MTQLQLIFAKMAIMSYGMTMTVRLFRYQIEMPLIGSRLLSEKNMRDEADLLSEFNEKGVRYGNELIVFKNFCSEFINACRLARLGVVGVEGFYLLEDGRVRPNLEEVADFSDIEDDNLDRYVEACANAARVFIEHMLVTGKSNGYCFTLTESLS